MMKFNHVIIAKLEYNDLPPDMSNLILEARYYMSPNEKTIGDIIDYEGTPMVVIVAGMSKREVVEEVNTYLKEQNKFISMTKKYFLSGTGKSEMNSLCEIIDKLEVHHTLRS